MVAKFLKSIVVLGCFLMFLDCFHNSSFDQWWGPPNGRGINCKPWPFVFRRFDVFLNLEKNIFVIKNNSFGTPILFYQMPKKDFQRQNFGNVSTKKNKGQLVKLVADKVMREKSVKLNKTIANNHTMFKNPNPKIQPQNLHYLGKQNRSPLIIIFFVIKN